MLSIGIGDANLVAYNDMSRDILFLTDTVDISTRINVRGFIISSLVVSFGQDEKVRKE